MKDILKFIYSIVLVLGKVFVLSVFGGTIIFILWPFAIPAAFPGVVEAGSIAANLTWLQSVCLTWIFSLLIRATQINNNNKIELPHTRPEN